MFTVYEVRGEVSPLVYYGYCQGADALKSFMTGASRPDDKRKDVEFMALQGGVVTVTLLQQADDELDAFLERNRLRSSSQSYTAPTSWPLASRLNDTQKAEVSKQAILWDLWGRKTAREAYEDGLWVRADLEPAREKHGKQCIIDALLQLSPSIFHEQYVAPYR